ncbi:response regulator transcription factor [Paenibacillus spongiae]|uniref:Response regulator transcription factor n=1 Tax=Paenibacillus spongiae TaxID=2909671 RepID=A0ABY5SID8_9BACL|nr:response regulator transcription factor [Paenibacillus spongiae]
MKVLVVEDDLSMQKAIGMGLRKFGYAVDVASDGEQSLRLAQVNEYDAIVLDLNLPKIDGIDVLKEIRKFNQEIKVLILSARSEVEDKIAGLDVGANDYMAKPFHFKELEARLRALLRRKFILTDTRISHGDFQIDTALKQIYVRNQLIDVTKKEYGILEYLMIHKDKIISAEEIIEHVWDSQTDLFSNTFKVHINSLKKKLAVHLGDQEIVRNTRGIGYFIAGVQHESV